MIKVIYGGKGSGKTKRILDWANEVADTATGSVVFVDNKDCYMYDLKNTIRFIDTNEYEIVGPKFFLGFLFGIAAQDFDLEYLFIDGFLRIVNHPLDTLEEMIRKMDEFSQKRNITIIMTVSNGEGEPPEFLKKYIGE